MPHCPYCHAKHIWGLPEDSTNSGEYLHGRRLPHHGEKLRCGNCGAIFRVDIHLGRRGFRRLLLRAAERAGWHAFRH